MVKSVPCTGCGRPIDAAKLALHTIKKTTALLIPNNRTKCCYKGTCLVCKKKSSYDIDFVEEKEPQRKT